MQTAGRDVDSGLTEKSGLAIVDQKQNIAEATFRLKFALQNAKKTVTGICDDVVLIRNARRNPKTIAIKSKSVRRSEEPTGPLTSGQKSSLLKDASDENSRL